MRPPDEGDLYFPEPVRVTDTLDLHGFFPEQAPEVLGAFLENAASLGLRTLRIVHGKGRSRMKFEVIRFLRTRPDVLRFHDAPPESGGWGATLVEMRPPS
ncbi:MAG: Smr/MutS family protein [bacterium]|nr:Smr/MutS family protein [bacterium]